MSQPQAGYLGASGSSVPWEDTCVKWPPEKATVVLGMETMRRCKDLWMDGPENLDTDTGHGWRTTCFSDPGTPSACQSHQ